MRVNVTITPRVYTVVFIVVVGGFAMGGMWCRSTRAAPHLSTFDGLLSTRIASAFRGTVFFLRYDPVRVGSLLYDYHYNSRTTPHRTKLKTQIRSKRNRSTKI